MSTKKNKKRINRRTLEINGDELRYRLLDRYDSLKEATMKILPKNCDGYIAAACLRGAIGIREARIIEEKTGISREVFVINEKRHDEPLPFTDEDIVLEETCVPAPVLTFSVSVSEELHDWLKDVVYQAMREALN